MAIEKEQAFLKCLVSNSNAYNSKNYLKNISKLYKNSILIFLKIF